MVRRHAVSFHPPRSYAVHLAPGRYHLVPVGQGGYPQFRPRRPGVGKRPGKNCAGPGCNVDNLASAGGVFPQPAVRVGGSAVQLDNTAVLVLVPLRQGVSLYPQPGPLPGDRPDYPGSWPGTHGSSCTILLDGRNADTPAQRDGEARRLDSVHRRHVFTAGRGAGNEHRPARPLPVRRAYLVLAEEPLLSPRHGGGGPGSNDAYRLALPRDGFSPPADDLLAHPDPGAALFPGRVPAAVHPRMAGYTLRAGETATAASRSGQHHVHAGRRGLRCLPHAVLPSHRADITAAGIGTDNRCSGRQNIPLRCTGSTPAVHELPVCAHQTAWLHQRSVSANGVPYRSLEPGVFQLNSSRRGANRRDCDTAVAGGAGQSQTAGRQIRPADPSLPVRPGGIDGLFCHVALLGNTGSVLAENHATGTLPGGPDNAAGRHFVETDFPGGDGGSHPVPGQLPARVPLPGRYSSFVRVVQGPPDLPGPGTDTAAGYRGATAAYSKQDGQAVRFPGKFVSGQRNSHAAHHVLFCPFQPGIGDGTAVCHIGLDGAGRRYLPEARSQKTSRQRTGTGTIFRGDVSFRADHHHLVFCPDLSLVPQSQHGADRFHSGAGVFLSQRRVPHAAQQPGNSGHRRSFPQLGGTDRQRDTRTVCLQDHVPDDLLPPSTGPDRTFSLQRAGGHPDGINVYQAPCSRFVQPHRAIRRSGHGYRSLFRHNRLPRALSV